jgi:hypothetical protein
MRREGIADFVGIGMGRYGLGESVCLVMSCPLLMPTLTYLCKYVQGIGTFVRTYDGQANSSNVCFSYDRYSYPSSSVYDSCLFCEKGGGKFCSEFWPY